MNIFNLLNNDAEKLSITILECDLSELTEDNNCSEKIKMFIDDILEIVPEWNEVIGRKQHITHDYTIDIHTLLAFKRVKDSESYKELNKDQKLILLYATLLHDIEKIENTVDPEHPQRGAEKASNILYRLGFPEEFINAVYLLIKHHQIIGLVASNRIELSLDELVKLLHKPELINLLLILTMADIKSVKRNEKFYCKTVEENIQKLKKELNEKFH